MYYINSLPNESGNYGNPMGQPFPDSIILPNNLLNDYINAKGFVTLVIENNQVINLTVNEEALAAYEVTIQPSSESNTDSETSETDDINSMLIDHEYRLVLLELGLAE